MPLVSDLLEMLLSHIFQVQSSFSSLAVYITSGPGLSDAFRLLKMDFTSETERYTLESSRIGTMRWDPGGPLRI